MEQEKAIGCRSSLFGVEVRRTKHLVSAVEIERELGLSVELMKRFIRPSGAHIIF